jgi:hypothetical protein
MDTDFEWNFPNVFVLVGAVKKNDDNQIVGFDDILMLIGTEGPALAVFTDKEGAEEYRNRYCLGSQLFQLSTPLLFLQFLHNQLGEGTCFVAIDPREINRSITCATIISIIRQFANRTDES